MDILGKYAENITEKVKDIYMYVLMEKMICATL
jgi:hypothetical protein